nr:MAG TPA: hypothetical protein [Caudoviricetes sp.]
MNSANFEAIKTVRYCLRVIDNKLGYGFRQKSYSRWAGRELLLLLEKNTDKPPLILIEEFRDKMDDLSCISKNGYIFSCAKDMAEFVIDLLINI